MVDLIKIKFLSEDQLRERAIIEGNTLAGWGVPHYRYIPLDKRDVGYYAPYYGSLNRKALREDLSNIRRKASTFKWQVKECNTLEFEAMKERYTSLISYFKEVKLKVSEGSLSVLDLNAAEVALRDMEAFHYHIINLSRFDDDAEKPAYFKETEAQDFEDFMLTYLRGPGSHLLHTWVAALARDNPVVSQECSLNGLGQLSEGQIASFTKLSKPSILIEGVVTEKDPLLFKALELRDGYLKIPLAALCYFDRGESKDFVEITELTNSDIDAILVLHGGAAYKKLEAAAQAAINLR